MFICLPAHITTLLSGLHEAGFSACAVGGCVRDSLLGKTPHDWDVATAARPEQVKTLFSGFRALDTGLRHGTVTLLTDGGPVEVTTYRVESGYSDHRRPDGVLFTDDQQADLARRDFTVNAMAFDGEKLIDPFGGQDDLRMRRIRAVGDPQARFAEDGLRILRALRFSAQLGFTVEARTGAALLQRCGLLKEISAERVRTELWTLLSGDCVPVLRSFAPVFAVILPELAPTFGFDQRNRHHVYGVWEHTLHALEAAPPDQLLRLALLLHDCGKPSCFSVGKDAQGHFYGHADKSAVLADAALRRLRFDNGTRERIVRLIALHDHDLPPTEKGIRRWLTRLPPEDLRLLIALKRADNAGQNPKYSRAAEWDEAERILGEVLARNECHSLAQLAVRGEDLLALGYRGQEVGQKLNELLETVIAGAKNDRESLLKHVKRKENQ